MSKLTLSIDNKIITTAKDLAAKQHTSVSEMFTNFIKAVAVKEKQYGKLSPLAKQATGLVKIDANKDYKELLTDSLMDKYNL